MKKMYVFFADDAAAQKLLEHPAIKDLQEEGLIARTKRLWRATIIVVGSERMYHQLHDHRCATKHFFWLSPRPETVGRKTEVGTADEAASFIHSMYLAMNPN
jgi:hypothetical protein